MAKDPAFLFYPGDWLGGTMGMTIEQKGAYMELLIFQFNNGPFTEAQAQQVLSICFTSVWQVVSKKFTKVDSLYFNIRLRDEIDKRRKFSESRRNNAKGNKSTSKAKKAYAQHMENENENEIRIKNIKEPISKLDIFGALFEDEMYIEGLAMAHKGKDIKQAFEECYIHHSSAKNPPTEVGEWKQKLNTWLSIKKNGHTNDKRKSNSDAIKAAIADDIYQESRRK